MANETTKLRGSATTGIPFWDMMLSFGATTAEAARPADTTRVAADVQVIALGAEALHVGARQVAGDTTRVRRIVVETPAEQSVILREERVVVERRKPTSASLAQGAAEGLFTETIVEMSDSFEVAESWKSVRVTEEVVLRREVTTRTETVREMVRHDELLLEQTGRTLPAPRREAAPKAKRDVTVPGVQQISLPTPTQLAADLAKVAERFDTNAAQQDQAVATLHETIQPEAPKSDVHVPLQTAAEMPKQADKPARKG